MRIFYYATRYAQRRDACLALFTGVRARTHVCANTAESESPLRDTAFYIYTHYTHARARARQRLSHICTSRIDLYIARFAR